MSHLQLPSWTRRIRFHYPCQAKGFVFNLHQKSLICQLTCYQTDVDHQQCIPSVPAAAASLRACFVRTVRTPYVAEEKLWEARSSIIQLPLQRPDVPLMPLSFLEDHQICCSAHSDLHSFKQRLPKAFKATPRYRGPALCFGRRIHCRIRANKGRSRFRQASRCCCPHAI